MEKRGEGSVLSLKRDRLFRGGARAVASRGLYLSVEGYWFSNSVPYPPRPSEREGNDESSLPLARSLAGRRSFARCSLCSLARISTFVGSFVGPLVGFDRRPIGRSIARTHAAHLALSIRDKGETTPP